MPVAEVTELYPSNFRDPVATLRAIADDIERGDYEHVHTVAVALFSDQLYCFGAGPDSEAPTVALVFNAAGLRMAREIEEHGR